MLQSAGWQSCLRLSCDRCGESLVTSAINTQLRSARNLLDIDAPLAAGCAGEVSRSPQPHMIERWSYFRAYRVKAQAIAPSASVRISASSSSWPRRVPAYFSRARHQVVGVIELYSRPTCAGSARPRRPTTAPEFAIVGYPAGIVLDQVAASPFQECGPRASRLLPPSTA